MVADWWPTFPWVRGLLHPAEHKLREVGGRDVIRIRMNAIKRLNIPESSWPTHKLNAWTVGKAEIPAEVDERPNR